MSADTHAGRVYRTPAGVSDYIRIMRLDHATKHIFVVPGLILAFLLRGQHASLAIWPIIAGFLVAVVIASSNYVINEYLDREFDIHHPTKSARAAVQSEMRGSIIVLQWGVLVVVGCLLAASASWLMLWVAVTFALQGVLYNVRPLRTKDIAYLDVVSESINNPLRLLLGWVMIDPHTLPPSSLIIAYWSGGAFLMGTKRLSEYRQIVTAQGKSLLVRYRKSFAGYTEMSLAASCMVYALVSGMTLAVFFVKYRIEYVLVLPFIAVLFGHYLALSMQPDSTAQRPERLFDEWRLLLMVAAVVLMFGICTVARMPFLDPLTSQRYITLD